ncbi:Ig-like domain-containing protein, partial [Stenoxybacter acetivorans]|uniref:Ig-like domain-containing protein n=1 Tax=Stenoxybacter acetivorans TaxID=422441 RepID=UPI00055FD81F
ADTGNQLVLENDTGNLIWARTTVEDNCLNSVEYFSIDNITPLLTEGSIDVDHAVAWWGWKPILGYGAVITAAIIGLSQWDDEDAPPPPPPAPEPLLYLDSPIFKDADGTDVTKGTDVANSKIATHASIFGRAENIADGTKIKITIKNDASAALAAGVDEVVVFTTVVNGKWAVHNVDISALKQGEHSLLVVVAALDANGNEIAHIEHDAGLITQAPANGIDVPDYQLAAPVNPHDPLTGTGKPGNLITITFPDGSTATTTVGKDGRWEIANPGLDGSHTNAEPGHGGKDLIGDQVTVSQTDPGGAAIPQINGQDPITGTGAPGNDIIIYFPNGSTTTAIVDKDGNWSAPNPGDFKDGDKLAVVEEDPYGNATVKQVTVPDATAPDTPVVNLPLNGQDPITGKGEPDATVTVVLPDGSTATTTVGKDGNWIVPNPGNFEDGDKITVSQEDKAGNDSPKVIETIPDATAPSTPIVNHPINGQDPITGKGEPDATVTVELPDGSTVTTTVGKDGNWSVPNPGDFEDGDEIVVSQEDKAGNDSPKTTESVDDATPPSTPIVNEPVNGQDPITGTGEPDATVTVELPDGSTVTTTVGGDGNWSVPNPGNLEDGDEIVVSQEDEAGNDSPKVTVTVPDATAPVISITDIAGDNVFNQAEAAGAGVIKGTTDAENGQTVTVKISDGVKTVSGTGTVNNGTWEITGINLAGLREGRIDVTADVKDKAGNAAPTASGSASLDTVAPSKPATPTSYDDNVDPVRDAHSTAPSSNDPTPGINIPQGLTDTPTLYVDG